MIKIKTQDEIQIMKEGGAILAKILKELSMAVKLGRTTKDLDKLAEELVFKSRTFSSEKVRDLKPAFLNYRGYPAVLCTSINDEIVHGLPSDRKLQKGDLLKLDMGVLWKGFYTDSAVTVLVGQEVEVRNAPAGAKSKSHSNFHFLVGGGLAFDKKTLLKKKLIRVTRESLDLGIRQAKIGNTIGDIGSVIQKYVEKNGFNVIRNLVGHGIGRELHEEPQVPNYLPAGRQVASSGTGQKLVEGMVIAIEPMVVTGDWETEEGPDGFVFQTKDSGLAAHFEHTIAITEKGPLVLTR